jgi:hypothetical protein
LSFTSLAQIQEKKQGLFKLTYVYGEVYLKGNYKNQNETIGQNKEKQSRALLTSGLLLKTSSYLWNPKFLIIDLNAQYSPEKIRDKYLVTPDRSEVNTLKSLDGRLILLKDKFITVIANSTLNENYSTRENLSNIRNNLSSYGAQLSLKTNFLPLFISYNDGKMVQKELATNRVFTSQNRTFDARTSWNYSKYDKNEVSFNLTDQTFKEDLLYKNRTKNYFTTMQNSFSDSARTINISSLISNLKRVGYDSTNRFQVYESIIFTPINQLDILTNYDYTNYAEPLYKSNQHNAKLTIRHRLYLSLTTEAFASFNQLNHTLYNDNLREAGFSLKYTKKIPSGRFNMSYSYSILQKAWNTTTRDILIKHEEYYLSDGQILLLKRPYIDKTSILITDVSGTIIYQEFFDYVLVDRNNFIEVQRVIGGQIPNNTSIYIDYTTTQPEKYSFDANTQVFNTNVSFIKNIVNIYYRNTWVDYANLKNSEMLTLNYLTDNLIGCSANFKFGDCGIEYNNYKSTIIPYQLTRYFVTFQWLFFKKVQLSMNGNIRNYYMTQEKAKRNFSDANISTSLLITPKCKLDVNLGYMKQAGLQMDLDLFTARSEITFRFKQLQLSAKVELYNRNYMMDKIYSNAIYFQAKRVFGKK